MSKDDSIPEVPNNPVLPKWWQARQAAAGEENYLALISRDLGQMMDDLEELRLYEEHQIQGGLDAYRAISAQDRSPEQMAIVSDAMLRLTSRRTMSLTNATYQDLLSTGSLQLIRNRELRDQIVAFHEGSPPLEKNSPPPKMAVANNSSTKNALFLLWISNSRSYADDPDPIWSLPSSSAEWRAIKVHLLQRIRTSGYARQRSESLLQETGALRDAVDAELERQ